MLAFRHIETGTVHKTEEPADYEASDEWELVGEIPVGIEPQFAIVDGDQVVEDAPLKKNMLCDACDRERESLMRDFLTTGEAKMLCYANKALEVVKRGLLGDAFLDLSDAEIAIQFPFAHAEADLSGDSIVDVLARFEQGARASTAELARLEAEAQLAKRDIRGE